MTSTPTNSPSLTSAQPSSRPTDSNIYPNGKHYYIFLVAYLVGLSAFGSFVNDMYLPTLPEMTRYFDCSVSVVQLGLTMGMIGLGIGQLIMGPVSDKYGRKPVLIITLSIFIIAAIVSVFSPTIHFFLGCRLVQGIGASGGYFLSRTIPADIYSGRPLAKMMALIGAINGFAPASAPVLGGLLAVADGWKGIFYVLAGFAALLICVGIPLKESLKPQNRFKGRLIDAFKEYPMLIKNKRFMIHTLLKGSALGLLFAYCSSAPFIMQDHFGWSEVHFGLFMGFNALFVAFGAMMALKFKVLKRAGYVGGWTLLIATFAQFGVLFFLNNFWAYELTMLPIVFSLGMIFTVGNTLAMNEGRSNAGGASALLGLTGYVFGAIVAPLVGIGNIMHSTAITFVVLAVITLAFAYATKALSPDPNMVKK